MQGPQTALLGPLKEVLESMTGGYEVMKEVVAALQDTERGKTASMTVLLQELQERQAGKPSREEQERLRQEVSLSYQTMVMLVMNDGQEHINAQLALCPDVSLARLFKPGMGNAWKHGWRHTAVKTCG